MLFYPFASLLRPLVPWFVAPSRLRVGESRVTLMKVSEALLAGGTGGKGGAVTPATGSFPDMLMQARMRARADTCRCTPWCKRLCQSCLWPAAWQMPRGVTILYPRTLRRTRRRRRVATA